VNLLISCNLRKRRRLHVSKPYRRFEFLSLRQQSGLQRKSTPHLHDNTRNMPVFRDSSSTNRTGENGLVCGEERYCPAFSLDGTDAVRF
jgi:hypothetical protein